MSATSDSLITAIEEFANQNWNAIPKGTADLGAFVLEVLEHLEADWERGNTASYELNRFSSNSGKPVIFYA